MSLRTFQSSLSPQTRDRSLFRLGLASLGFAATLVLSAFNVSHVDAQARTFRGAARGGSRIQFVSDAPLERTTGTNDEVSCELQADPANVASLRGNVHVRIAAFRTGIDLRDEHLRGPDWLDAQHHPEAIFEVVSVEGTGALTPNQVVRARVRGRFTLHGRTREVTANAQIRYSTGGSEANSLRVQASFDIQLSDYNVSISSPVRLKVSNTIRINVTLRANAS